MSLRVVRTVGVAAVVSIVSTTPLGLVPASAALAATPGSYVVKAGDYLYGIAAYSGVGIDALLAANHLTLRSIIVPGQHLAIPGSAPTTSSSNASSNASATAASVAIAAAKSQIGKQYRFGWAGPDAFDCSGLVMWAWGRAGISMLHYTGYQLAAFPNVATTDLQPGDVVFFHPDHHHNGIYLGNNLIIHAPAPGMAVQISWVPLGIITGAMRPQ